MKKCFLPVVLVAVFWPVCAEQPAGIKTVLTNEKGHGITGAYVMAVPLGPAGGMSYAARSGPKGEVELTNVRPGLYMICAQLPGSAYLDPCEWSDPVRVAVQPGKTVSLEKVQVQQGSLLRVRMKDDPGKNYLSKLKDQKTDIIIGVMRYSGRLSMLHTASEDSSGRTLHTAIPFDLPLRLAIYTDQLTFADERGATLTPMAVSDTVTSDTVKGSIHSPILIPIKHDSGKSNPDLNLIITGMK